MIRMSAREDVVAQYFARSYITANSGFLKQMVIGPDEAAVLIKNGKVEDVLTQEKATEMVQENWTCDSGKARRLLGFRPAVNLVEGLQAALEWYRREGWL